MIAWLQACWLRERIVVLLYRVFVRPISHWHDDWPVYDWCENDYCSQAAAQPSQKQNRMKKAEATTESQRRTRRLEILIALRKMYRNVLRAQGLHSQPSRCMKPRNKVCYLACLLSLPCVSFYLQMSTQQFILITCPPSLGQVGYNLRVQIVDWSIQRRADIISHCDLHMVQSRGFIA